MRVPSQTINTFDLYIDPETNSLSYSSGKNAYGIIIADAIRTVSGELQLNINKGIPYFDTIFKDVNGMAIWRSFVSDTISGYEFVKSIKSFVSQFDSESKILKYNIVVETDLGEVSISNENVIGPVGPGGGGGMDNLIQDGKFYLPVFMVDGVQYYRMFTENRDPEMETVTTQISENLYIKEAGRFEITTDAFI